MWLQSGLGWSAGGGPVSLRRGRAGQTLGKAGWPLPRALPCDTTLFAQPLRPADPSSQSDLTSSGDKQTRGGGQFLPEIPPPPVLPGKAFSCLKAALDRICASTCPDWLIELLPFRASVRFFGGQSWVVEE